MNKSVLRREFLLAAGVAAVAAPASLCVSPDAAATVAGGPGKQARLFAGWMEDFIHKAVELQSHSADITTYWLKSTEPEYLASLRHLAFQNGVALSGIAIRTEMCQATPLFAPRKFTAFRSGLTRASGWVHRTCVYLAATFPAALPKSRGLTGWQKP
jgi:hypothetical protein